jgi:RimJ/RimL family protein N-acetyltransferase
VVVVAVAGAAAAAEATVAATVGSGLRSALLRVRTGTIKTKDLDLVPYRPTDLLALVKGAAEFRSSFGFPAADGLREFLLGPEVSHGYLDMLRSSFEPDVWLHGFAVVDRKETLVVGNTAFVGPPNENGEVEIAYGVVPSFEGRGYATQAATALTEFAFADPRVKTVIAHTLPEKNASTRILEKIGFTFIGEIEHPEDGTIWRWEKQLERITSGE